MKHKEARLHILLSILFASIILGCITHGPRLLAYMSEKSGYYAASEESDYAIIPVTLGRAALHVLIADTEERRVKGLSYRESLGKDQAMLFVFDEPGKHGIWMKSMKFPIDIIWLDSNLHVIHIVKEASPRSFPEVFEPKDDASFVLEVNAGFSEKHDIGIGSELVLYR
ncbi:MAG: hypothetical protein RLY57_270 [Candidatus Parcubacteria bacterium]|jgi:uncharacterized membrane protein (UPF0127 family)